MLIETSSVFEVEVVFMVVLDEFTILVVLGALLLGNSEILAELHVPYFFYYYQDICRCSPQLQY